jgi:hypothetical protein
VKKLVLVGMVGVAAITAAVALNQWYDGGVQPNDLSQRNLLTPRGQQSTPPLPVQPTLDVVRTNESGDMVIAGRAMPKSEITVLDNGLVIGSVIADERGDWVFVPNGVLSPGPRQIGLLAKLPDGRIVPSDRTVMLVLPGKS